MHSCENIIIAMDVPNIAMSAEVAAGGRGGARFDVDVICEYIRTRRGTSDARWPRVICSQTAHSFEGQFPTMEPYLVKNGFKMVYPTQKRGYRPVETEVPEIRNEADLRKAMLDSTKVPERKSRPKGSERGAVDRSMILTIMTQVARGYQNNRPINTVVLLTGDGDFVDPIHILKGFGISVEVMAARGSTSQSLISAANLFIPMGPDDPEDFDRKFMFFESDCSTSSEQVRPTH